jgi:hypothetical protein
MEIAFAAIATVIEAAERGFVRSLASNGHGKSKIIFVVQGGATAPQSQ